MKLFFIIISLVLVGCGDSDQKQDQQEQAGQDTTGEQVEAPADLPQLMVARVPVAEDGTEDLSQIDMRSVHSSDGNDEDLTTESFENASALELTELDEDSSTQSWGFYGWGTPWYPGKLLGRGTWWGRNPYLSYGSNRYGFAPYRQYGYGYGNTRCGRYNYYVYRPCRVNCGVAQQPVNYPAGPVTNTPVPDAPVSAQPLPGGPVAGQPGSGNNGVPDQSLPDYPGQGGQGQGQPAQYPQSFPNQ